jgi:hypothetical protein
MSKTSYKNIDELVERINIDLAKLNKGELSLEDLDSLVDAGKDLTERLIILRFKAYDRHGEPQPLKMKSEPQESVDEDVQFDFTSDEQPKEEPAVEQVGFDFALNFDEPESTPQVEEAVVEEQDVEDKELEAQAVEIEEPEDKSTLNEVFKSEEDQSLRKKFQKSPISDIKSQISIANKFEYISTLFNGDSAQYENAIQTLNSFKEGEDAKSKLNEYAAEFDWDLENKMILKFIELVERRYL